MGKNTKRCVRCQNEYSKKELFCPSCGAIDERRASQINALEIKAIHNPEIGLLCKGCGSIFPNDQTKCTYCGETVTKEGTKSIVSMRSDELKKVITPIGGYYSGKPVTSKQYIKKIKTTKNPNLTPCPACNHPISTQAESCPNCGQPTGVHVCPKCRSVNTKVISGASKATSIFMWGVFAANKVVSRYQCKDCGHKF